MVIFKWLYYAILEKQDRGKHEKIKTGKKGMFIAYEYTMSRRKIHRILTYFIATVWIANGLFCKVLNLVPRHQQIVARILGEEYSGILIKMIGTAEIFMAMWILIGIKTRLNAATQIVVIATMNILEFVLVPDLLLWGRANSVFALMFMLVIYYTEFILNKRLAQQT